MGSHEEEKDFEEHKSHFFIRIILALFLILMMVSFIIPQFAVKVDPIPQDIEKIKFNFSLDNRLDSLEQVKNLEIDEDIRFAATSIATSSCEGYSDVCYAKAIYNYVKNNVQYISDPSYEYIQSPKETLLSHAGDCDDHAVLIYFLMNAIGIPAKVVIVPRHAFNEIYIKDSPKKYIGKNSWISIDATCKSCKFGTLSKDYENKVRI